MLFPGFCFLYKRLNIFLLVLYFYLQDCNLVPMKIAVHVLKVLVLNDLIKAVSSIKLHSWSISDFSISSGILGALDVCFNICPCWRSLSTTSTCSGIYILCFFVLIAQTFPAMTYE